MSRLGDARLNTLSRGVSLFLAGQCNLSCEYCYQRGHRGSGSMTWATARGALEWLLSCGSRRISVEFNGGEPLLESAMLRRAVEFVESNLPTGTVVEYSVTTNGTLLTPEILAFLFDHGFTISISFDGVEAAQRKRGEGTFEILDRLVDRIREEHPAQLASRVKILLTLVASTIPYLTRSVSYLLGKGFQAIHIAPRLTPDPDWSAPCRESLEREMEALVRLSLDHWRRTGTVPVTLLAGARPPDAGAPAGDFLCNVSATSSLSVDPDGRAWACPVFASSLQELPPLARQASRALDLGEISSGPFSRRVAGLPERVGKLRLFTRRLAKRSSYGACADCRFVNDCHICPGSISHDPANRDPDLVPDFACAFNAVTLAARDRFDEMTGGQISAAWRRRVNEAVRTLKEAIEASIALSAAPRPESDG
jgi:sulfatase maturation enzyme AslB (radical SAM superfamily)